MTRVSLVVLLVACGDAVPEDEAHTCVVTRSDDFGGERWVSTMFEPGKPTRFTWYRDEVMQAHWDFTYDDARRIVRMDQDVDLDGVADFFDTYEHTPTSTITRHGSKLDDAFEAVEHTIDPDDRITSTVTDTGAVTYELGPDGEIVRMFVDALEADTNIRFTRLVTNRYEGGRLVEEITTDSRFGTPTSWTYSYEERPQQLLVRTPTKQWTYTYDAEGRLVRAEEATLGGEDPWTKELVYSADGAVAITGYRDGPAGTTTLSGACGFRPVLPASPRSGPRPGTQWSLGTPSLPSPY